MSKRPCVYCGADVDEDWHALCDGCLFDSNHASNTLPILVVIGLIALVIGVIGYVFFF